METTRQYHRGRQFNDFRQSIGMPWPILSKQSGIPEAELLILKDQEQIDDERYASIAAGLGTDLETLKSYRPDGGSVHFSDVKGGINSGIQKFEENSNAKFEYTDSALIKEFVAKLEAKHEQLHESEQARIKLLEENNRLQEEMIRMLRGDGR